MKNYNKECGHALPKTAPRLALGSMVICPSTTAKAFSPITLITISIVGMIILKVVGLIMLLLLVFVSDRILKRLKRVITITRGTGFLILLLDCFDFLNLQIWIYISLNQQTGVHFSPIYYEPFPCLVLRLASRLLFVSSAHACHPLLVSSDDFYHRPKYELERDSNKYYP